MGKRKEPPSMEEQLAVACRRLREEVANWIHHRDFGCSDPFWSDGTNMNLIVNHVIAYRKEIEEICRNSGLPLPPEMFIPIPPKVSNAWMADVHSPRVTRIFASNDGPVHYRVVYDPDNRRLF